MWIRTLHLTRIKHAKQFKPRTCDFHVDSRMVRWNYVQHFSFIAWCSSLLSSSWPSRSIKLMYTRVYFYSDYETGSCTKYRLVNFWIQLPTHLISLKWITTVFRSIPIPENNQFHLSFLSLLLNCSLQSPAPNQLSPSSESITTNVPINVIKMHHR